MAALVLLARTGPRSNVAPPCSRRWCSRRWCSGRPHLKPKEETSGPEPPTPAPKGRRYRAIYGEEGFKENPIERAAREANELLEKHKMADGEQVGKGPKPVWSFLDASPRGWWPAGDWFIGTRPNEKGELVASKGVMKAKVKMRGLSSTEKAREMRDVYLASQSTWQRFCVALSQRLTPQEFDQLRFLQFLLGILALAFAIPTAFNLYDAYELRQAFDLSEEKDPKMHLIVADIRLIESLRHKEAKKLWNTMRETMPIPPDKRAQLEMFWREAIKLGWVRLAPENEHFIAEPFHMKYIPGFTTINPAIVEK